MGMGGISIWQLVIILVIIVLLFGTKKLRNLGADLGSALKSFKEAMRQGEEQGDRPDEAERLPPGGPEKTSQTEGTAREHDRV